MLRGLGGGGTYNRDAGFLAGAGARVGLTILNLCRCWFGLVMAGLRYGFRVLDSSYPPASNGSRYMNGLCPR